MKTLLYVLAALYTLDIIGKVIVLGTGEIPQRTPKSIASDLVACIAVVILIVWVLARQH